MNDETAATQNVSATIEAVVIRADGTCENLGVVASTADGSMTIDQEED